MDRITKIIGVIGASRASADGMQKAREVGRLIAEHGCALVCGGLYGIMEAASEGARQAGGFVIGILPGDEREEANSFVSLAIPTGMGLLRNILIVRTAQAVIAIEGGYGTLSEIAFALHLNKPVVSLNSFELDNDPNITKAFSSEDAVKKALSMIS